jgi:hypothetical protein
MARGDLGQPAPLERWQKQAMEQAGDAQHREERQDEEDEG